MEFYTEPERKIEIADRADVIVAGGGPAEYSAAIAAARNGADTILIEQHNCVGGMATTGMMSHFTGGCDSVLFNEMMDRVQKETRGEGVAGYFLTVPGRDCAEMHRVENLLCNIFDGGTVKVYFLFADTGKKAWARHMAVKDDPLLRAELVRILGPEHVKVQGMDQHAK